MNEATPDRIEAAAVAIRDTIFPNHAVAVDGTHRDMARAALTAALAATDTEEGWCSACQSRYPEVRCVVLGGTYCQDSWHDAKPVEPEPDDKAALVAILIRHVGVGNNALRVLDAILAAGFRRSQPEPTRGIEQVLSAIDRKRDDLWRAGCDNGAATPLSKPWDSTVLAVCDALDDVATYIRTVTGTETTGDDHG